MIETLRRSQNLSDEQLKILLESNQYDDELRENANAVRLEKYGHTVYLRGLIEFTNYCRNDCYYCGIRHSNRNASRYRLTQEDILECCKEGYELGYRTFVLQGGEDPYFTDEKVCQIVSSIREKYPDCAVTLSIGEKSHESYQAYFEAGAERYLLRHETANPKHYHKLHPDCMSGEHRKQCLFDLKSIGYQVGAGIMVGSPHQTTEHIIEDIRFMQELQPDMIGIGPFLPHKDTPFRDESRGSLELTLRLLGILRLMFPEVLLPATTALGTIHPLGREMGLKMGANVVMPNLSPVSVRKKYMLYDDKICTGDESAQCINCMQARVKSIGFEVVSARGDALRIQKQKEA
ncbi:MAG TPA: [FeFe] hydrogenase H-cluster radical SAM maturase HydE [Ruminococcus sp.]|nr:[FeFe] hydrogenase H-cluster radical SAM maturase HydE [Ruminococcus sp.]